ncbi:hypothetical protein [Pseudarthrobacter sulfonivorans]|uniref:hypothetical protein n=1 Tax=Pseudarthrobacter sulfonivorans TaxID=121292 RepID=UPI0021064A44|nr:hypothetical protein [Pseudarthrobacter sulfonivorans]
MDPKFSLPKATRRIIVAARTSPEKRASGITLFAVESVTSGFSWGRKPDKVGQDQSDTAKLFSDNVRVMDAEVLGEVESGFIHMMQQLPQERLSAASSNVAHAKQILLETIEYANPKGIRISHRISPAQQVSARPSHHPDRSC